MKWIEANTFILVKEAHTITQAPHGWSEVKHTTYMTAFESTVKPYGIVWS